MILPLPLLAPFLLGVGWETGAQVNAIPAQPLPWQHAGLGDGGADPIWSTSPKTVPELVGRPERPPDQAFRIPLAGPVFLFGQAEKDTLVPVQGSRFIGQTGLTWKLPVQAGIELLLSCGPEVTYIDPLRPERTQDHPALPFQTRLLRVDVQCRWRLLSKLGLECQGSVCPALNPGEPDEFFQDIHLALPLSRGGQLNLGAKRYWEKAADAKPGPDTGQLYGDFRLAW